MLDNTSHAAVSPAQAAATAFGRWSRARRAMTVMSLLGLRLSGPLMKALWYRLRGRRDRAGAWVEALPPVLERLGPAYVKFAQIVGTRQDLLPPRACAALSRLHDEVRPMTEEEARTALTEQYGPGWAEILPGLDFTPIGSGSIACVYRATLADGTAVAVKLRRPDLELGMRRDVDLIQTVMELTAKMPGLRGVPLGDMGRAVGGSVLQQLDLLAEAKALTELRLNLADLDFVVVPEALRAHSRPGALVMTFVPAVRGDIASARMPEGEHRRQLARQTMLSVFDMLFRTGLVHCDLHPGNLRLDGDRVVILDAGLTFRVPDRTRELLALFFLNMGFRNGTACADAVLESADGIRSGADLAAFRADMEALIDHYGGMQSREFNLVAFAGELFALQRRHGLYASSQFVFPLLALLMVEGSVRTLDPDLDFQKLARPVIMQAAYASPGHED